MSARILIHPVAARGAAGDLLAETLAAYGFDMTVMVVFSRWTARRNLYELVEELGPVLDLDTLEVVGTLFRRGDGEMFFHLSVSAQVAA